MKLSVISLKGVEFEGDITSLNIKTSAGEITVLSNHRPLLTSLTPGRAVVINKEGEKINFDIISGFLEVGVNNEATVLAR